MDPRFLLHQTTEERERFNRTEVRPFYEQIENYDWTDAADHFRGAETVMHRLRERWIRRSLVRLHVAGRLLDIGCGSGLMLRHLPIGSVGIDVNPRNVARAKRYAPLADVRLGDAEHLSFSAASFDGVIITEVLEHLVFPERAVSEIVRVLRPGGICLGSVPRRTVVWRFRRLSRTCPGNEPFHNEFRRRELQQLLSPLTGLDIAAPWWRLQFFFVGWKGKAV